MAFLAMAAFAQVRWPAAPSFVSGSTRVANCGPNPILTVGQCSASRCRPDVQLTWDVYLKGKPQTPERSPPAAGESPKTSSTATMPPPHPSLYSMRVTMTYKVYRLPIPPDSGQFGLHQFAWLALLA